MGRPRRRRGAGAHSDVRDFNARGDQPTDAIKLKEMDPRDF
jgi:hypothetical protein